MLNTSKIMLLNFFIIFNLMIVGCQSNIDHFYHEDSTTGAIVEIPVTSVKPIIYNLYEYQGNLVIADEYDQALPDKKGRDIVYRKKLGYFLHEKIDDVNLNQIVDRNSYSELIPNVLYKDKNHVYFFRKEGGCVLCLKKLALNPDNIRIYDNEVIGDNKRIFCLYNGNEITVKSVLDFKTYKTSEGHVFRISGHNIYFQCEAYDLQQFQDTFDFISPKDRTAITKLLEGK